MSNNCKLLMLANILATTAIAIFGQQQQQPLSQESEIERFHTANTTTGKILSEFQTIAAAIEAERPQRRRPQQQHQDNEQYSKVKLATLNVSSTTTRPQRIPQSVVQHEVASTTALATTISTTLTAGNGKSPKLAAAQKTQLMSHQRSWNDDNNNNDHGLMLLKSNGNLNNAAARLKQTAIGDKQLTDDKLIVVVAASSISPRSNRDQVSKVATTKDVVAKPNDQLSALELNNDVDVDEYVWQDRKQHILTNNMNSIQVLHSKYEIVKVDNIEGQKSVATHKPTIKIKVLEKLKSSNVLKAATDKQNAKEAEDDAFMTWKMNDTNNIKNSETKFMTTKDTASVEGKIFSRFNKAKKRNAIKDAAAEGEGKETETNRKDDQTADITESDSSDLEANSKSSNKAIKLSGEETEQNIEKISKKAINKKWSKITKKDIKTTKEEEWEKFEENERKIPRIAMKKDKRMFKEKNTKIKTKMHKEEYSQFKEDMIKKPKVAAERKLLKKEATITKIEFAEDKFRMLKAENLQIPKEASKEEWRKFKEEVVQTSTKAAEEDWKMLKEQNFQIPKETPKEEWRKLKVKVVQTSTEAADENWKMLKEENFQIPKETSKEEWGEWKMELKKGIVQTSTEEDWQRSKEKAVKCLTEASKEQWRKFKQNFIKTTKETDAKQVRRKPREAGRKRDAKEELKLKNEPQKPMKATAKATTSAWSKFEEQEETAKEEMKKFPVKYYNKTTLPAAQIEWKTMQKIVTDKEAKNKLNQDGLELNHLSRTKINKNSTTVKETREQILPAANVWNEQNVQKLVDRKAAMKIYNSLERDTKTIEQTLKELNLMGKKAKRSKGSLRNITENLPTESNKAADYEDLENSKNSDNGFGNKTESNHITRAENETAIEVKRQPKSEITIGIENDSKRLSVMDTEYNSNGAVNIDGESEKSSDKIAAVAVQNGIDTEKSSKNETSSEIESGIAHDNDVKSENDNVYNRIEKTIDTDKEINNSRNDFGMKVQTNIVSDYDENSTFDTIHNNSKVTFDSNNENVKTKIAQIEAKSAIKSALISDDDNRSNTDAQYKNSISTINSNSEHLLLTDGKKSATDSDKVIFNEKSGIKETKFKTMPQIGGGNDNKNFIDVKNITTKSANDNSSENFSISSDNKSSTDSYNESRAKNNTDREVKKSTRSSYVQKNVNITKNITTESGIDSVNEHFTLGDNNNNFTDSNAETIMATNIKNYSKRYSDIEHDTDSGYAYISANDTLYSSIESDIHSASFKISDDKISSNDKKSFNTSEIQRKTKNNTNNFNIIYNDTEKMHAADIENVSKTKIKMPINSESENFVSSEQSSDSKDFTDSEIIISHGTKSEYKNETENNTESFSKVESEPDDLSATKIYRNSKRDHNARHDEALDNVHSTKVLNTNITIDSSYEKFENFHENFTKINRVTEGTNNSVNKNFIDHNFINITANHLKYFNATALLLTSHQENQHKGQKLLKENVKSTTTTDIKLTVDALEQHSLNTKTIFSPSTLASKHKSSFNDQRIQTKASYVADNNNEDKAAAAVAAVTIKAMNEQQFNESALFDAESQNNQHNSNATTKHIIAETTTATTIAKTTKTTTLSMLPKISTGRRIKMRDASHSNAREVEEATPTTTTTATTTATTSTDILVNTSKPTIAMSSNVGVNNNIQTSSLHTLLNSGYLPTTKATVAATIFAVTAAAATTGSTSLDYFNYLYNNNNSNNIAHIMSSSLAPNPTTLSSLLLSTTTVGAAAAPAAASTTPAWPVKHASVMEGDVILGGLMMVHSREDSITCGPIMPQGGIQALEAMLYTLDQVNKQQLLPNITLGAHILDDCDKDTYGLEMAVDFIKGM